MLKVDEPITQPHRAAMATDNNTLAAKAGPLYLAVHKKTIAKHIVPAFAMVYGRHAY
jgi:hypothetical protein